MKTAEIRITNFEDCIRAFEATEKQGEESGLNTKQKLRLRLLAEELESVCDDLGGVTLVAALVVP